MKNGSCSTGCGASASLGLLVLRVVVGLTLAWHGYDKLHEPLKSQFISHVGSMSLPGGEKLAYASIAAELGGGILLALGLLTRPAALLILINMGVAIFKAHAGQAYHDTPNKQLAASFAAAAAALLLGGAGKLSIDALIFCRRRPADEPDANEEIRESQRPL